MLKTFEEVTADLTPDELELIETLMNGLRKYGKDNPIKAPDLVSRWNTRSGRNYMTEVRLRKMVNYIRFNGLLPLIATSKGYFVSWDKEDIRNQVTSLEQRSRSIQSSADGLKRFL